MEKGKKWGIGFLCLYFVSVIGLILMVIIIDPYFHYHKPLTFLDYPLDKERYMNDGIIRNFDYNGMITGTSMTENFKTSEMDELFGTQSVKTSFAGASYFEINNCMKKALNENPKLQIIVRGLDTNAIIDSKDSVRFEEEIYPNYLYDNNLLNDIHYVLNKDVFFDTAQVVVRTFQGAGTTSFDEYGNWMEKAKFGKAAVQASYTRTDSTVEPIGLTEEEKQLVKENISQNVIELAIQYPNVDFYYFFTPYSIYWWDMTNRNGNVEKELDALKLATEMILPYQNIHLFAFFEEYEMVCNPDNYMDTVHYGAWINSQILNWMKQEEHQLTNENFQEYFQQIGTFYREYNYEKLAE